MARSDEDQARRLPCLDAADLGVMHPMRLAVIADIHGNLPALEAVLADIERRGIERIFNLVGANVRQWYDEMPKYQRIRRIEAALVPDAGKVGLTKKTLESYMKSSICIVCREGLDSDSPLCQSCFDQAPQTILYLRSKLARSERKATQFAAVCRSCSGLGWNEAIKCDSKDCPVFYSRIRHKADHGSAVAQIAPVLDALEQQEGQGLDW